MHVFLTGEIQIGKTTAIRRFLADRCDLRIGGFTTFWEGDRRDSGARLWLAGAAKGAARALIKRRTDAGMEDYPEVYDTLGPGFLEQSKDSDLILMDEIGVGENSAAHFHRAVLEILDGEIPVLGVVRALPGVLTDAVRAHGNVLAVTVTLQNREEVADRLIKTFVPGRGWPEDFCTSNAWR